MDKPCRICKQIKRLRDFYPKTDTRDGRDSACQDCRRADARRRQREQKEKLAAQSS